MTANSTPKTQYALKSAKRVALIAVCTALIEGCKLALAALPNVEVVTLLCALFGYVFGFYGVISVVLFVAIEPLIWGFGSWVISYFIYWPLVALIFMLLGKKKIRHRAIVTAVAVALTVFFGVLTSVVDLLFYTNIQALIKEFAAYYLRGTVFYVTQIVCNLLLFAFAFTPLSKVLIKLNKMFFTPVKVKKIEPSGEIPEEKHETDLPSEENVFTPLINEGDTNKLPTDENRLKEKPQE